LGVGPIPDWIINLSTVGADLRSMVRRPLRQMEAAMSPDPQRAESLQPTAPPTNQDLTPKPSRAAYEKIKSTRPSDDNIEVSIPRAALWKCFISALVLATMFVICCCVAIVLARFDVSWVDVVTLPGSGSRSRQVDGVPGSTAARFNCSKDYASWQLDWTVRKQHWCCAHTGRACPPANRHHCRGTAAQVEAWSEDQRQYCCKHENYGCPSSYDCTGGRSSRLLWDRLKREWCCKHKDVGCTSLHNCTTANATETMGWSSAKLNWCCEHKHLGCITNSSERDAGHHLAHFILKPRSKAQGMIAGQRTQMK
jgi:hypothetical protein